MGVEGHRARAADALPPRDVTARDLALAVVHERDVNIICQGQAERKLEVGLLAGTLGVSRQREAQVPPPS